MALWSMSPGWDCFFSKQKRFLTFQIDQATIAHTSISLPVSLSSIWLAREWKSCTTTELFCNFPLTSAQTLVANEYSHNAWQTDSSAWPQIAQLWSTGSLRLAILAWVGRTSEQARQRKFHTFSGTCNLHILFHNLLSSCALECSTSPPWFKWRAIR